MPEFIRSNIKVTIGVLVSNSIDTIRDCMESLKPLLTAVPSELIVVDTKGAESDGSIKVAAEYTDQIYPFTWCNDFSAARNVCLSHAKGEWFLYLDDDEWFDDLTELIHFFNSDECNHYFSGYYYMHNYQANGGYSTSVVGRMVRRTKNTRFVGRAHEGFNEIYPPHKQFQCFAHHSGYAFNSLDEKKRHQERNVSLLREELKEIGYTPRICAQMVQEMLSIGETKQEGLQLCEEYSKELQRAGKLSDACSQWLLLCKARVFKQNEDYHSVIKEAEEIRANYPLTQVGKLSLAGIVVETAVKLGDIKMIAENVAIYREQKEWLVKHPQQAITQTNLDLTRYQTKEYEQNIFHVGAVSEMMLGNYEIAFCYWKQIDWNHEESYEYQQELLQTLRHLQDKTALLRYYQAFYKEKYFLPENQTYLPRECRELIKGY